MSSVVNKSKNKFAPKAKVRARTVSSNTQSAVESSPSVSSTPAPASAPTPAPKPPQVTLDVPPPAPLAPEASGLLPTPVSQSPPYDDGSIPIPSEHQNLGIPTLEDEALVGRQSVPSQLVDEPGAPARPPVSRKTTESDRVALMNGGIPQLEDDGIGWTDATKVGEVAEKVKAATNKKPKPREAPKETEDVDMDEADTTEETTGTVAKKRTRKAPVVPRKRKVAAPPATPVTDADASPVSSRRSARAKEPKEPKVKIPRKPRAPRKPKPGERTRRAKTPEDAEERTIEEGVVKMKDLCSDLKMGKKSKRLKELEATDWNEVGREQAALRAQLAEQRARGEIVAETDEQRLERLAQANQARQSSRPVAAPQMRVVDGQLVLDEESLHVNRHQRDALEVDEMEIVEENVHTRIVNSSTWSKREKGDRWEEDTTERFFEALSMFGTDFEMISKLFPGRSRRMIKNKFNCEERKNPGRITAAFKTRVAVDMDEYAEIAGQKFPDPNRLKEELQRLCDEHEAEADAQKEQAVAMERERQELANKAMREAEGGIVVVQEQTGRKRKRKNNDAYKQGEVVLGLSLEEYERERLLYADDD